VVEVSVDAQVVRATITEFGNIGSRKTTAGTLPDVALLEIFDFFLDDYHPNSNAWHALVHVCRRWRYVVFTSPRRLSLKLVCTNKTPVKEMLDIWPDLPITINVPYAQLNGVDNIFAALEHRDRVCGIELHGIPTSQLKRLAAVQELFPALTNLRLSTRSKDVTVLPDSFLGGSAPRLRTVFLHSISFPTLPKFLLSAKDLVDLRLRDIPHSGYSSPGEMVTGLSALTRLKHLRLEFRSPRSRPGQPGGRHPPLQTRILLPALLFLKFKGVSEYLEALVARISAPLLRTVEISFFNQLVFDTLQFPQFIGRADNFSTLSKAEVVFHHVSVKIGVSPRRKTDDRTTLHLTISCRELDWQVSSLAQVCSTFLTPFTGLERLDIHEGSFWRPLGQEDMDNDQWPELLRPFASIKHLHLSENLAIRIAPTLQDLAANRVTDVLPALRKLFLKMPELSEPVKEGFTHFIAARRLSGHPVVVYYWKRGTWVVGASRDN
jgi:F-box-like